MEYLKNVSSLMLETEKCIGCGMCINVCPHNVFRLSEKKASITDKDKCMECGACKKNCPVGAISVNAGVGCAAAIISGLISGSEPECGCSSSKTSKKKTCCG
jgi:NAD-dependent dihydropyrimidine dehydrogenase PreA subunit